MNNRSPRSGSTKGLGGARVGGCDLLNGEARSSPYPFRNLALVLTPGCDPSCSFALAEASEPIAAGTVAAITSRDSYVDLSKPIEGRLP